MAKNNNLGDFLTDIANAIRTKKGTSGTIPAQNFSSEILSIQGGGSGMTYEDYARTLYLAQGQIEKFQSAWEHSLEVNIEEISEDSVNFNPRGTAQYPNGETNGVIIPDGVTIIGSYAFQNWTSNKHLLVIPNTVINIKGRAFVNWSSNNQPLVIPNSVTSIGVRAFNGWGLNNHPLVIPDSVTSIGIWVFAGWGLVPYIIIHATTPPDLESSNAFGSQNDAPIYVPHNSVSAYKNATNWSALSARIFSIEEL